MSENMSLARERLTRLYRFLRGYTNIRYTFPRTIDDQQWSLWFSDLQAHPAIQIGFIAPPSQDDDNSPAGTEESDCILSVKRPRLTKPPVPPASIAEWLQTGWDDPFKSEVAVRTTMNEKGANQVIVHFEDDQKRVRDLANWHPIWAEWAENERPSMQTMKIFEKVYELYGRLRREGESLELIIGDGILSWKFKYSFIYHPLLLLRVQLEFDPNVPEFRIIDVGETPELYSVALRDIEEVDSKELGKFHEELDRGAYHPLGGDDTSGFLRRIIQSLSPSHGQYIGNELPPADAPGGLLGRHPVLFLRRRTQGFGLALERILEHISGRENLPAPLLGVVGIEHVRQGDISGGLSEADLPGGEPEGVLFSKHWNKEQLRIADSLDRYGSVLVQGPPGTGKTHTIANLIGHLLAQGKTVLVTAHTSKALRVLRDKIVDPLKPLCVSILDNDLESRRQLEESVHHIVERLTHGDPRALEAEAVKLASMRRKLVEETHNLQQQLLEAVGSEYREIVVSGEGFEPSKAARLIAEGMGKHDWIPEPIEIGSTLPLSLAELSDLYQTNLSVTPEDEQEIILGLPNPENLAIPEAFEELVKYLAGRNDGEEENEYWEPLSHSHDLVQDLENLINEARFLGNEILEAEVWELYALDSGTKGEAHRSSWETLLSLTESLEALAAESQQVRIFHRPQLVSDLSLDEQEKIAHELAKEAHRRGGSIGGLSLVLKPAWRKYIQAVRVKSGQPKSADHFRALAAAAALTRMRADLMMLWEHLITLRGGPPLDDPLGEPERITAQYKMKCRYWLEFHSDKLEPLIRTLGQHGFRWDTFRQRQTPDSSPMGELRATGQTLATQLTEVLRLRVFAIRQRDARAKLKGLSRQLQAVEARSRLVAALQGAIRELDTTAYRTVYVRISNLYRRQEYLRRRHELLARLERSAPGWATAIRNRHEIHGKAELAGDPVLAWRWRQLSQELVRRASLFAPEIQERLQDRTTTLRRVTAELIEDRAWAAQLRRTTLVQRQDLVGWLNVMKRAGKWTTEKAPQLRAEASRLLSRARESVPVWIMPLARVVEQFDPRTAHFDVVIVDEASQCDALTLATLYMCDQAVVVGDHEQVSPEAVGQELERVEALISEHLRDIPNAILYDGRRSVYDIARESFGAPILLIEHFRCVPEIIQFSNLLCYNGRIRPLRESSTSILKPSVVPYRVNNAYSERKLNQVEARELVKLLVSASQEPAYQGKTFGVISLVGEEQARYIHSLLLKYLPQVEYERRQIICGTAAQFQGDERDVIFLSLVDAPTGNPLSMRQDDRFRQRFNVAASRAKDQMWVIYSLDSHMDLKPGDLRRRLIEYALDPEAATRNLIQESARVQSPFEKEVMQRLVAAGYPVRAQWPVGYYRIDLVIEGLRVAIECDGDRWHPLEKLREDLARQAVLERLDWKFIRIRGSEFFREKNLTMERVFQSLSQLGVEPGGYALANDTSNSSDLVSSIIRRAEEIWQEPENRGEEPDIDPLSRGLRQNSLKDKVKAHSECVRPRANANNIKVVEQISLTSNLSRPSAEQIGLFPGEYCHGNGSATSHKNEPIEKEGITRNRNLSNEVAFLREKGLQVIDKRPVGGALWVIGGIELSDTMEELKERGIRFSFAEKGGRVTGRRPAWYTK